MAFGNTLRAGMWRSGLLAVSGACCPQVSPRDHWGISCWTLQLTAQVDSHIYEHYRVISIVNVMIVKLLLLFTMMIMIIMLYIYGETSMYMYMRMYI